MKVNKLVKSYADTTVLHGVDFEIPKGKITSFIGPNGAGKSTVMNLISRLILRDTGDILFKGKDIKDYKSSDLAKKIAILTQSNNINMKLTVRELVSFGRFPYSAARLTEEDIKMVNKAINYMELEQMSDDYIDELSGGQRQRALIAMIIAQDTEYVLLDEPTNNLDIYHSSNMMKIVRKLCYDLNKTVIMVLHDINYASFYSDYICAFYEGKIELFSTTKDVITKDVLSKIYNTNLDIVDYNDKNLCIYY